MQKEGAEVNDDPEDISFLTKGVEVLSGSGNIAIACALLFGLIYCFKPELPTTSQMHF